MSTWVDPAKHKLYKSLCVRICNAKKDAIAYSEEAGDRCDKRQHDLERMTYERSALLADNYHPISEELLEELMECQPEYKSPYTPKPITTATKSTQTDLIGEVKATQTKTPSNSDSSDDEDRPYSDEEPEPKKIRLMNRCHDLKMPPAQSVVAPFCVCCWTLLCGEQSVHTVPFIISE
jgi:hypothetical protein